MTEVSRPGRPGGSFIESVPWLNTGLRVLLALFGAYGVTLLATAVMSVALPLPRIEATLAAIMLGFVVQVLGVIWVIAAASLARAVAGIALPAALLGGLLYLLPAGGAA